MCECRVPYFCLLWQYRLLKDPLIFYWIVLTPISMFWYLLLFQWFIFLISYFSDDQLAYGELQTSPKCQCFKPKNIYLLFILHVQCSYSKICDKAAVTHTHFHYFTAKTREIRPSIHMCFCLEMTLIWT